MPLPSKIKGKIIKLISDEVCFSYLCCEINSEYSNFLKKSHLFSSQIWAICAGFSRDSFSLLHCITPYQLGRLKGQQFPVDSAWLAGLWQSRGGSWNHLNAPSATTVFPCSAGKTRRAGSWDTCLLRHLCHSKMCSLPRMPPTDSFREAGLLICQLRASRERNLGRQREHAATYALWPSLGSRAASHPQYFIHCSQSQRPMRFHGEGI